MTQPLSAFHAVLQTDDLLSNLRAGVIGEGAVFDGAFGPRKIVYADYVASGRALRQVEDFVLNHVLPFYGNTHTEVSHCGATSTRLREAARAEIARICGADSRYATIFTGPGATTGLNRVVALLGVADAVAAGQKVRVFIGPYEHHSNILPWRESGAEVVTIPEGLTGGPDLDALTAALQDAPEDAMKVGSFSAASNVTGIVTDSDAVTRILRRHGAIAVWDYAGAGPYLPISMQAGTDAQKDAVILSAHKFLGGPGASGVTILNQALVTRRIPVMPGGGTVRFVSPWQQDYATDLTSREEAGTPNIIGDIRAGLCFLVKESIGAAVMAQRHAALDSRARARWARNPAIEILGNPDATARLPIFSLRIKLGAGYADPHAFTRGLSDHFGIQARSGCACAGPYAHQLLGISRDASARLRSEILAGNDANKPGWTRLNLSVLATDAKADFIIDAVDQLARGEIPLTNAA